MKLIDVFIIGELPNTKVFLDEKNAVAYNDKHFKGGEILKQTISEIDFEIAWNNNTIEDLPEDFTDMYSLNWHSTKPDDSPYVFNPKPLLKNFSEVLNEPTPPPMLPEIEPAELEKMNKKELLQYCLQLSQTFESFKTEFKPVKRLTDAEIISIINKRNEIKNTITQYEKLIESINNFRLVSNESDPLKASNAYVALHSVTPTGEPEILKITKFPVINAFKKAACDSLDGKVRSLKDALDELQIY